MEIRGSMVALVTPFKPDGSVNYAKLKELIDWHIDSGTDAIVALGTTGEATTLSHEECLKVIATSVEHAAGRIPIIGGSGSNNTQVMLEKSLEYQDLGVDALLLITPYYLRANSEGIYQHFAAVADKVTVPTILYNVPSRTNTMIPVEVVKRLALHPRVAAIKEASGDVGYTAQVARYVSEDFALLTGNDDAILTTLALGGSGVISVVNNLLPTMTKSIVSDFFAGDLAGARRTQLEYLDLINAMFSDPNPIPVKEAMNLVGMEVGGFRLPLTEISEPSRGTLEAAMRERGLL